LTFATYSAASARSEALLAVVAMPSIQQRIAENGIHDTLEHEAFGSLLRQEFAEWPAEIKKLDISAE
jgi:hypothetical protein